MKFLIIGLGNFGEKYQFTRHNIGFDILDVFAKEFEEQFKLEKYAHVLRVKFRSLFLVLLKPTTYMNLSGEAIRYYLRKEKVKPENILVLVDDMDISFGSIRIKPKGSDGGHNGLKSIIHCIKNSQFNRLRFGVGNNFLNNRQADYVLSKWKEEEAKELPKIIDDAIAAIKVFLVLGVQPAMNQFNKKKKI